MASGRNGGRTRTGHFKPALRRLALFACLLSVSACTEAKPPNVVVITLDVLRPDRLSLHGYPRPTSPNIDRLAQDAAVFDNAHTLSPSTPPSMASVMTSRHPYWGQAMGQWGSYPEMHHGMARLFGPDEEIAGLPSGAMTLAEALSKAGYRTIGIITNPYLKSEFNFDQGFDDYEQFVPSDWNYNPTADRVRDKARAWIEREQQGRRDAPFFMYLHFMDIHVPYEPPPPWSRFFAANYREDGTDRSLTGRFVETTDPEERRALLEHSSALYDNAIRFVDTMVGEILAELETRGVLDDTLVVIHSDHGEEFLDHGDTSHKGTVYEELTRIALIIRYPALTEGGRRIEGLASTLDIMPTILDIVGVRPTWPVDGISLMPLITGEQTAVVDRLIGSLHPRAFGRSMRWKWILPSPGAKDLLFDLEADPGEREDVAERHPRVVESFRADWRRHAAARDAEWSGAVVRPLPEAPGTVSEETAVLLRALGYVVD